MAHFNNLALSLLLKAYLAVFVGYYCHIFVDFFGSLAACMYSLVVFFFGIS
jgi:hypothetical protein